MKKIKDNGNRINKDLILNYLSEHNLSKKELCEKCNITLNNLEKLLKNDLSVKISTIYKLCVYTNISSDKLYYNIFDK